MGDDGDGAYPLGGPRLWLGPTRRGEYTLHKHTTNSTCLRMYMLRSVAVSARVWTRTRRTHVFRGWRRRGTWCRGRMARTCSLCGGTGRRL